MIDLAKDRNARPELTGVELKDELGTSYKFKAVVEAQGQKGMIAELKATSNENPNFRFVRLTDELVWITPDLVLEFTRYLNREREKRAGVA
jgi:hypothetical protein